MADSPENAAPQPVVNEPAPAAEPQAPVAQEPELVDEIPVAPLTPRQAAFVHEYLVDLNATKAAIRAGYSPNGASVTGSRLLAYVNIARAVEKGKEQRASRVNVTQESVLHEMSLLANARIDHYLVDDAGNIHLAPGAPEGAMAAIKSKKIKRTIKEDNEGNVTQTVDVEIQLWDKPGTLKLMGRHTGLFPDRVEVTGAGGGPVETVTKIERVIIDDKAKS